MIGIYEIKNVVNGNCYIGSSSNLTKRWHQHLYLLRKGNHHSIILQKAWDKYGENNFVYNVLEYCIQEDILDKENSYLLKYEPKYNILREAYSCKGRKDTKETLAKKRKYAIDNRVKPPVINERAVVMLDFDTQQDLIEFSSITKALKHLNKSTTMNCGINRCCNGKQAYAFNYKWRWKDSTYIYKKATFLPLSPIEKQYILENMAVLSGAQISRNLNRGVSVVQKFIKKNKE